MNLLREPQEHLEREDVSIECPSTRENIVFEHSSRTPPTRTLSLPQPTTLLTITFGNKEALKTLIKQIPDYNSSGGISKLLEFIDKFEAF